MRRDRGEELDIRQAMLGRCFDWRAHGAVHLSVHSEDGIAVSAPLAGASTSIALRSSAGQHPLSDGLGLGHSIAALSHLLSAHAANCPLLCRRTQLSRVPTNCRTTTLPSG